MKDVIALQCAKEKSAKIHAKWISFFFLCIKKEQQFFAYFAYTMSGKASVTTKRNAIRPT